MCQGMWQSVRNLFTRNPDTRGSPILFFKWEINLISYCKGVNNSWLHKYITDLFQTTKKTSLSHVVWLLMRIVLEIERLLDVAAGRARGQ